MKTISSTRKTYIFDMDGVICEEGPTFERSLAEPIYEAIDIMQALCNQGHKIIIFTARGWAEYEMTKEWLFKHDVPHNQLILGKPIGDYWIEDRALDFSTWQNTIRDTINGKK